MQHFYGDPSRDLAAVVEAAFAASDAGEPGIIGLTSAPLPGPRLQDLVTSTTLDVTVHDGFDYWVSDVEDSAELADALEQANGAATPTARLASVEAAYWCNVGTKEHLRWVMPEPEDELLTALARLHVSGADVIVPEARFVGMFRAHGLLAPVWDLTVGTGAEALEEPAAAFKAALDEALADTSPAHPRAALGPIGAGEPSGHDPVGALTVVEVLALASVTRPRAGRAPARDAMDLTGLETSVSGLLDHHGVRSRTVVEEVALATVSKPRAGTFPSRSHGPHQVSRRSLRELLNHRPGVHLNHRGAARRTP